MRRIRWLTREHDPTAPLDWRVPATLLATLFLNFTFPNGIYGGSAVQRPWAGWLIVTLFVALSTVPGFLLPALAVHSSRGSLTALIESALGTAPSLAIRAVTVLFLLCSVSLLGRTALWLLCHRFEQPLGPMVEWAYAAALLTLVVVTTTQILPDLATMAHFTNKLTLAIFVAALIRVRDGWPAVALADSLPPLESPGRGVAELVAFTAPMCFLCAHFASRLATRRDIVKTGIAGLAVPAFVALVLIAAIGTATGASSFYRPSLMPNAAMALFSGAAPSALPARMALAAVSLFGLMRLNTHFLLNHIDAGTDEIGHRLILKVAAVAAMAWAMTSTTDAVGAMFSWSARCLGAVAGVVSADFVSRKPRSDAAPRIDWNGITALVAGVGISAFVPDYGVLLSGVVAFFTGTVANLVRTR